MTEKVEVIQADIDRAQDILDSWFNRSSIENILARHRLAHQQTATEAVRDEVPWHGERPETVCEAIARFWAEWEEDRAGTGVYLPEELAEDAGNFANDLYDHLAALRNPQPLSSDEGEAPMSCPECRMGRPGHTAECSRTPNLLLGRRTAKPICSAEGCHRTEPCGPFCRDNGNFDTPLQGQQQVTNTQSEAIRSAALEEAAKVAEKVRDDLFAEHGTTEPDTNWSGYTGRYAEWYEMLEEQADAIANDIRALKSRPAPVEATNANSIAVEGWRPIESAPKDGTDILLISSRDLGHSQIVASWEPSEVDPTACWLTLDGPHYHRDAFTHWMPLPAAPGTTPAKAVEGEELEQQVQALESALWGAYPIVSAELADAIDNGHVNLIETLQPLKDRIDKVLNRDKSVFRDTPKNLHNVRIHLGDEIARSLVERGHASCGQEAVRIAATPTKPLAVEADEVERRKFYKSDWPLGRLLEARDRGLVLDDGEAWRYQYTHKDAKGEYDLLYRPISPDQTTDEFDRLVKAFRAAPLNGDAGCDKLTDDEWRIVAQAALKAMKNG